MTAKKNTTTTDDITTTDLGDETLEQPNLAAQAGDPARISVACQELIRSAIARLDTLAIDTGVQPAAKTAKAIYDLANDLEVELSNILGG